MQYVDTEYDGGGVDDVVDTYDSYVTTAGGLISGDDGMMDPSMIPLEEGGGPAGTTAAAGAPSAFNYDDARIASLPRVLLMGPRRGGKTSIQVCFRCWYLVGSFFCESL